MKTSFKYLALLSAMPLLPLLTACNDRLEIDIDSDIPYEKIIGTWEHRGYGNIYRFTEDSAKLYEYTQAGCVVGDAPTLEEMKVLLVNGSSVDKNGQYRHSRDCL